MNASGEGLFEVDLSEVTPKSGGGKRQPEKGAFKKPQSTADLDLDFLDEECGEGEEIAAAPAAASVSTPPTPAATAVQAPASAPVATAPTAATPVVTVSQSTCLYFDIETVPDEERAELFDLPEIPPFRETLHADCIDPSETTSWTVDKFEEYVARMNPEYTWLNAVMELEQSRGKSGGKEKPRDGVCKILTKGLSARQAHLEKLTAREKKMSTCPEMCRIVAFGWAVGENTPRSLVLGDRANEFSSGQPIDEALLLKAIWQVFAKGLPLVGFNCLSFDLQVIRARSILLGVQPTVTINDSPYSNRQVIDLAVRRYGRVIPEFGLKKLARLYGVPVPSGADGSQVSALMAESPEKVGEYVRSDIQVTRGLYEKWRGHWTGIE